MDETGQKNTNDSMGIYWIIKKVATWNGVFSSFDDKLKEKFRNATNGKCKFRKDLFIIKKQIEAGCVTLVP
jgi:hypothetical protein